MGATKFRIDKDVLEETDRARKKIDELADIQNIAGKDLEFLNLTEATFYIKKLHGELIVLKKNFWEKVACIQHSVESLEGKLSANVESITARCNAVEDLLLGIPNIEGRVESTLLRTRALDSLLEKVSSILREAANQLRDGT